MRTRKFLSVCLAVLMAALLCAPMFASAADTKTALQFGSDGKFRIMQVNDTQDVQSINSNTISFIKAAIDKYDPDLVVFNGDQLSDVFPFASVKNYTTVINAYCNVMKETNTPFLFTFGNHDHDRANVMSEDDQAKLYEAYDQCYKSEAAYTYSAGTYYVPVLSSDGSKTALGIYMTDTNNKRSEGGYAGITTEELAWYNTTSAAVKAANGGNAVPAIDFQHIPVNEVYNQFLIEAPYSDSGVQYSTVTKSFWRLRNASELAAKGSTLDAGSWMGEIPCSENPGVVTGQYQAWVANGDVFAAFFAHDHINNFAGTTSDGIYMGYNGGTGFTPYGKGSQRSVRIFDLDENNLTSSGLDNASSCYEVYYNELTGKNDTSFADFFTFNILTKVMQFIYTLFGWALKK